MGMRRMVAVVVVGMVLASAPLRAQEQAMLGDAQPSVWSDLGWGTASIGTNLGYIPAKMLYALGGGLVGLLAWGVTAGNDEVAKGILGPSFGGTWAVTPDMLRGKDPIYFNGPTYERAS